MKRARDGAHVPTSARNLAAGFVLAGAVLALPEWALRLIGFRYAALPPITVNLLPDPNAVGYGM